MASREFLKIAEEVTDPAHKQQLDAELAADYAEMEAIIENCTSKEFHEPPHIPDDGCPNCNYYAK